MPERRLRYYRGRWPDPEVPAGEPLRLLYEVDHATDSVLRSVDVFPDGRVTRNSIALEARGGAVCPSLIGASWGDGFARAGLEEITARAFEDLYARGADEPFWCPRRDTA